MPDPTADPTYLAYQYGTDDRLRIRQETHEKYSEGANDWFDWVLNHLDLSPGQCILDVGCGNGKYLEPVQERQCRVVGIDASFGMLTAARDVANATLTQATFLQAHADALPVATASFERVMANHMLYHVPDQLAALQELRRVVKPGGVVLCATNASNSSNALYTAHYDAAVTLGYTPTPSMTDRFHLGHLALVQRVFPSAQVYVHPEAFLFPSVEPLLRYYASAMVDMIDDAPVDNSHRGPLIAAVAASLAHIEDREGGIRIPKDAGCFVARID